MDAADQEDSITTKEIPCIFYSFVKFSLGMA